MWQFEGPIAQNNDSPHATAYFSEENVAPAVHVVPSEDVAVCPPNATARKIDPFHTMSCQSPEGIDRDVHTEPVGEVAQFPLPTAQNTEPFQAMAFLFANDIDRDVHAIPLGDVAQMPEFPTAQKTVPFHATPTHVPVGIEPADHVTPSAEVAATPV